MRKKFIFAAAFFLLTFAGIHADDQSMNNWKPMKGSSQQPDGSIQLVLNRHRKNFSDGGVTQTLRNPKAGWYEVGIQVKGNNLTALSQWKQKKKADGTFIYRTKLHPLKKQIPDWESYKFVFDIPEEIVYAYVLCAVRTPVDNPNGTALVKEVYLKPSAKPAEKPVKKPVKKPAAKPASQANSNQPPAAVIEDYLNQITAAIPKSHPRLMYSPEIIARMKRMAASPEIAPYVRKLETRTEKSYQQLLTILAKDDGLGEKEPAGRRYHPLGEWGKTVGAAAILYRIKGEKKWADMGIDLLKKLTPWYNRRFKLGRAVSWYGFSRVLAVLAWDWLYDVMSPADRDAIAKEMIAHCKWLADYKFVSKLSPNGEGLNSPGSGFYSARCILPWYAGIAYYGEGYDDAFVQKELKEGLTGHLTMLTIRNEMAGDDGGSINSSPGYCYGTYNNVEFWFFISWNALTGKSIADNFQQMKLFPFWLTYTIFKGIDNLPYDFGTGGSWHIDNVFLAQLCYHALFRNFYSGPVCDLSDAIQAARPIRGWNHFDFLIYESPFYLFFDRTNPNPKIDPAFYQKLPKGYFFENLGQTYMHSGWTGKDTHVMFTCGSKSPSHKAQDENNFVIYKGGFLALSSGTRTADFTPEGRALYYAHDNNYKATSIANNVILIRMEEEKFKGWRIDPKKVGNHEGMNKSIGGIVRAFETNPDFTYIAGDSTACYNPGKAKQVVRQFLMIYPDLFVIYDTVKSVKADQKKTWQLHTQEEPVVKGDTFEVVQREGRLISRTLLPEKAQLVKIGGPGKEFWSDGKNYPLGPHLEKNIAAARKKGYDAPLWGAWRMFITDPAAKTDNAFLHVIQVGLKKEFTKMIPTRLVREKGMEGAHFVYNDVEYTILFDPAKIPAGRIKAVKNGRILYDRPFTEQVQKQRAADYLK